LRDWRAQVRADGQGAFPGNGHRGKPEDRVAELERKIGRQAMEIDFLKRALQHVEEQRRLQGLPSGAPSTSKSKEK
jgi:transposase-like protein